MANNKLKIGNLDAAILILQRMQGTYPSSSLVEIIENGIDALSPKIDITLCKRGGKIEIIITDYGRGVTAGEDGNCDMHRISTSICDSEKIKQKIEERKELQGEFAIGILGFAAIAENFEMRSRTKTSRLTRSMTLKAGTVDCDIKSHSTPMDVGTTVRMWPVRDSISHRFTGEKLSKFLGDKMADRIRENSTVITIYDKIKKKTLNVKPMDYKGERIPLKELRLLGNRKIKLDLFVVQQGATGRVSLIRKGTRLLENISEIEEFNCEPWNNPLLEGRIHNRFITITPNRTNVVVDDNLDEFIQAMKEIEEKIIEILKEIEKKRNKHDDQKIHVQVVKEMGALISQLPQEQYMLWDEKGCSSLSQEGFIDDKSTIKSKNTKKNGQKKKMVTLSDGPLSFLQISPNNYYAVFGETVKLQATAWTVKGEKIHNNDLKYSWKVRPTYMGEVFIDGDTCSFLTGDEPGKVEIEVNASLDFNGRVYTVMKYAEIIVSKNSKKRLGKSGLLKPIGVDAPGESWRSRYSSLGFEYNRGHEDYKRAEENKNIVRYLLVLFSKELVFHNFKGHGENDVLERFIEVITVMDNKNGKKKK